MAEDKPVTKGSDVEGADGSTEGDNPYSNPHIHADDFGGMAQMMPGGLVALAQDQIDGEQRKKISRWAEQQASSGSHGSGRMLRCNLGELKKYRKQVDLMAEAARKDIRQADKVAEAESTAQDVHGSVLFAKQLSAWGQDLVDEVKHTYKELDAYRKHLDTVIKNYQNQEDDTKVMFQDFQGKL